MTYSEPAPSWLSIGTTSATIIRPDLATAIAVSPAAGLWTYGAWVQIVAPNDLAAHMLVGVLWDIVTAGFNDAQMQIGTGAAGFEVVVATVRQVDRSAAGWQQGPFPIIPFVQIPANARVAARAASGAGGGGGSVVLVFAPRPLT